MITFPLVQHIGTPFRRRFFLLVGVLLLLYIPIIQSLIVAWLGRDDFSHGFLVPLISLYLVYHKRTLLLRQSLCPATILGSFFLLAGILFLVVGRLTATVSLQQISLLPVLAGLVLLNFGVIHFRWLLFPIVYLAFMLPPVIDPLLARAYWPFQLFTATISENLYRLAGIPVFRDQQCLHLPDTVLEVARECSGVRYLFSIIALAIPMAVFTQPTMVRKVALVACAILIGVLTNPLRVLLIGVVVYYFHGEVHGPMHVLEGVSVSMVGYVFLFLCVWGFGKIPHQKGEVHVQESPSAETVTEANSLTMQTLPWSLSLAMMLVAAGISFFHATREIPADHGLVLPDRIGEWISIKQHKVDDQLIFHDADLSTSRLYQNAQGELVFVNFAYFNSQNHQKKIVSYKNYFQTSDSVEVKFTTPSGGENSVRQTRIEVGSQKYITSYWYQIDGKIISSPVMEKYFSLRNTMSSNRNNGMAVCVSMAYNKKEDVPQKEKQLSEVITLLLPFSENIQGR